MGLGDCEERILCTTNTEKLGGLSVYYQVGACVVIAAVYSKYGSCGVNCWRASFDDSGVKFVATERISSEAERALRASC